MWVSVFKLYVSLFTLHPFGHFLATRTYQVLSLYTTPKTATHSNMYCKQIKARLTETKHTNQQKHPPKPPYLTFVAQHGLVEAKSQHQRPNDHGPAVKPFLLIHVEKAMPGHLKRLRKVRGHSRMMRDLLFGTV